MARWCPLIALCAGIIVCTLDAGAIAAAFPSDDVVHSALSPPAISQFLSRIDEPLRTYEGRRVLWARNPRFHKEARLEVSVSFDVGNGLTFEVVETSGSSYIVRKALLPSLEGEARMWRNGDPERYGLTPDNYEFLDTTLSDTEGDEVRIALRPRQKHPLLIDGAIYLSAPSSDLLRVEGPSRAHLD